MSYEGYSDSYRFWQTFLDKMKGKAGDLGGAALSEFGPGGAAVGKGIGDFLDWSVQKLFDAITARSRYKQGVWYVTIDGKTVPMTEEQMIEYSKKVNKSMGSPVQDPRWRTDPMSPLKPSPTPIVTPVVPYLPINPVNTTGGFNRDNSDTRSPSILIYNDGRRHIKQPHPSSRRNGNAAMPYNSQGFTKR